VREPRGRVRDLFLRLLGLLYLAAFLSLLTQVTLLFGAEGLLPAARYLERLGPTASFFTAPTIFWIDARDGTLWWAAAAGAAASLGLAAGVAPRWCLACAWTLYLSFATVGQDFLSFQWDNLLLEAGLLALLLAPGGLRPRRVPSPHPLVVFLVLWLVVRLHVESGAAKLLSGDPTWRDLSAIATYWETAPLPTWVAWYAHQLPMPVQRLMTLLVLAAELGVAWLVLAPRALRTAAFGLLAATQVAILATANYQTFNYLTLALLLFALDDRHLAWLAARLGRRLEPSPPRAAARATTVALATLVVVVVPVSLVPFLPWLGPRALPPAARAVRQAINPFRSLNAYHLFASMTLVRREAVVEGTADGVTWLPYEFRYKPGDPFRAPAFVAPHQPRVDFQLWFLLLGRGRAPYFERLLERLLEDPAAVAPLFTVDPFGGKPPREVRMAAYRYRFTDVPTRRATGAWWSREPIGMTPPRQLKAK
jgi:uncharacterized membrane protein YphA (DoxX/SURF4 family)